MLGKSALPVSLQRGVFFGVELSHTGYTCGFTDTLDLWRPLLSTDELTVLRGRYTVETCWILKHPLLPRTHVRHEPYFYCCGEERFLNFQKQKSEEEIKAVEKKRSAMEGFQPVVDI